MTPITSLMIPIVAAAVAVFMLSMIVHMAMPWHKGDYANVPDHDAAITAIGALKLTPDDYAVPNPQLPGGGKNPDFIADFERGPNRGGFHVDVAGLVSRLGFGSGAVAMRHEPKTWAAALTPAALRSVGSRDHVMRRLVARGVLSAAISERR